MDHLSGNGGTHRNKTDRVVLEKVELARGNARGGLGIASEWGGAGEAGHVRASARLGSSR